MFKPIVIRISLVLAVACLTSCDRVKKLQEECQRVDKEAENVLAETQLLDQRILSFGSVSAAATVTLERQTEALEQKAVLLQREIDSLKAKLAAIESASAAFSPKVDSYKAKYLR